MTQPEAPEPDDKDWTWTLREPCPACGFDAKNTAAAEVPALVDDVVVRFTTRLSAPDATVRSRPGTWSPTEYACHLRDVCDVFGERFTAMLTEDDPLFANWDQDDTAIEKAYWRQQPATATAELTAVAARINATLDGLDAAQLARPGRRSNGSVFTVESLAQYFAHDLVHHAHDVSAEG